MKSRKLRSRRYNASLERTSPPCGHTGGSLEYLIDSIQGAHVFYIMRLFMAKVQYRAVLTPWVREVTLFHLDRLHSPESLFQENH